MHPIYKLYIIWTYKTENCLSSGFYWYDPRFNTLIILYWHLDYWIPIHGMIKLFLPCSFNLRYDHSAELYIYDLSSNLKSTVIIGKGAWWLNG